MMKAVLKTLAISFGGGLALGAGIRLTQGPAKSRREPDVDLDPLLTRLKEVESRVSDMESAPRVETPISTAPLPSEVLGKTLVAFEARLASQLNEVEQVRTDIRRVDERLADLDSQLPVLVQSTVDVRFQEVERKLQHEFEQAQTRSMAAFVDTLQSKVVDRISTLETNLAEQSHAIGKLRDASQKSDENLQKMLVGIERLVDQTKAPPPQAPVAAPPPPVKRESPAAIYEAASAIVRREAIEAYDTPRATPIEPIKPPAPRTEKPTVADTPVVTTRVFEVPEETPVAAVVPEIPPAEKHEFVYKKVSAAEIPAPTPVAASPKVEIEVPKVEPEAPKVAAQTAIEVPPPAEPLKPEESYEWVNKIGLELLAPRSKPRLGWRIPLVIGLAAGLILIVGLIYSGMLQHFFEFGVAQPASTLASTSPAVAEAPAPGPTVKPHEPSVEIQVAREYQRRKDWTKAESSFRTILESNPDNRDAAIGLSDVLYQEQKYEESAAVLNKLRSAKSQ